MKTLTKTIALGILASAFIGGTTLVASAAPKGPVPFANFDMNSDGAVSKDEFTKAVAKMQGKNAANKATAPQFEDFDSNKDGAISKTELASAQSQHGHGATSHMNEKNSAQWQWQ